MKFFVLLDIMLSDEKYEEKFRFFKKFYKVGVIMFFIDEKF